MPLLLRAILWALLVVGISWVSQTKYFYLAGLIPLFPTFALIAHIVTANKWPQELKYTALFGMLALIPYFFYLLSVYYLADKMTPTMNFSISIVVWSLFAVGIFVLWNYLSIT